MQTSGPYGGGITAADFQLQQLQAVLSTGGNSMRDAAAALFAIRPAAPDQE